MTTLTFNQTLTDYAFGILPDVEPILSLADIFAPRVGAGTATGDFNLFDDKNAFLAYAAERAFGGERTQIKFGASTSTFSARPNGLEIGIDDGERDRAGEAGGPLLEQAKTRTLIVSAARSHLYKVLTVVKASVAATSGAGKWADPNVDPIGELDDQIEAIWNAAGILPNQLVLDFSMWLKLKNHPKVLARRPGADLPGINTEHLAAMLAAPSLNIRISDVAIGTTGFGSATKTKTGMVGTSAYMLFSSAMPDQYDASAFKTFSPSKSLFQQIRQYRADNKASDMYTSDWSADVKLVSDLLVKRIDFTA